MKIIVLKFIDGSMDVIDIPDCDIDIEDFLERSGYDTSNCVYLASRTDVSVTHRTAVLDSEGRPVLQEEEHGRGDLAVCWPWSQALMDQPGFEENAVLIDYPGSDVDYGGCAYRVNREWFENLPGSVRNGLETEDWTEPAEEDVWFNTLDPEGIRNVWKILCGNSDKELRRPDVEDACCSRWLNAGQSVKKEIYERLAA